jgi:hypothetical protein
MFASCTFPLSLCMISFATLNHEFRPDLETVKNIATNREDAGALAARSAGRGIWKTTRILCYGITLFTIAFSAYRLLP